MQVHARIDESFTLVYDAIVTRGGQAAALPTAVATGTAVAAAGFGLRPSIEEEDDAAILQRQPHRGRGSRRRLREVVAGLR